MDQISELDYLKSVKRKARFLYNFYYTYIEDKLARCTSEKRKIFHEASAALEIMHGMYETLKTGMRKRSYIEQIEFAEKWNTYIVCIEAIIAYEINDECILDEVTMDNSNAKLTARNIYREFSRQVEAKRTGYLN